MAGFISIQEHGANPNGTTLSTPAIQAAIDAAGKGGGTVYVPPGRYLTGMLTLRSGVTLTGGGTIDGNGPAFWRPPSKDSAWRGANHQCVMPIGGGSRSQARTRFGGPVARTAVACVRFRRQTTSSRPRSRPAPPTDGRSARGTGCRKHRRVRS